MIPIIIAIREDDTVATVIAEFSSAHAIVPSHRIVLTPEKTELTVEQIHQMQKDIQVSFSHNVLVALVGVDDSSSEVQNALLKSLEEDAERITFLLVVKNPSRVLSTIRSRCTLIYNHLSSLALKTEKETPVHFSFAENSEVNKETAVQRIDLYIQSSKVRDVATLAHILSIRSLIIDNNMNPVLALDEILLFLTKNSTIKERHEKK